MFYLHCNIIKAALVCRCPQWKIGKNRTFHINICLHALCHIIPRRREKRRVSFDHLTLPWSMSSRCAADAAFTSAEFAAAMDLAASKIISSKLRLSSASYQQKHKLVLQLSYGVPALFHCASPFQYAQFILTTYKHATVYAHSLMCHGREASIPALYSGGPTIKSRPTDCLSLLRFHWFYSIPKGKCQNSTFQ